MVSPIAPDLERLTGMISSREVRMLQKWLEEAT
jgi:hypothetical protein